MGSLSTLHTTDVVPVDLNAFLWRLESAIERLAGQAGDPALAAEYRGRATRRAEAIEALCWDGSGGFYADYDAACGRRRSALTAATVVPLHCGFCPPQRARRVAATVRERLLAPGGLGTTEHVTGEQWDRPNGWAPLQWLAVEGLRAQGIDDLADEIRSRWLRSVRSLYDRDGKLVEKYALRPDTAHPATGGGGGEYPLQDGFGWTNGVTRRWLHETTGGD